MPQVDKWGDEHDEQRHNLLDAASYELFRLRHRRGVVRLAVPTDENYDETQLADYSGVCGPCRDVRIRLARSGAGFRS